MQPPLTRVSITGYRSAREVVLDPGALCALVGESSSGKSTVLSAIWSLLEVAAPMPTSDDISRGAVRVHIEAQVRERTLFLDARPPATLNLNRDGGPPSLFFPANLRSTALLAPARGAAARVAERFVGVVPDPSGSWEASDGGLALVHAVGALVEANVRGVVVLIEEPELYLSPPVQRLLYRLLRELAGGGRNQVLYSTHAPIFLAVDRLDELVLVRHDARTGTSLVQPPALSRDLSFRALSEFDADRAEIFLSRAAVLVEGRTEKLALPFIFAAAGVDADREAITVVDCGGKGNIPLFAEICNACGIPYVVVHDRDAPRGAQPVEGERVANAAIARTAGRARTVMLVPDFEAVTGLTAKRAKPAAAWRHFQDHDGEIPAPLQRVVTRAVAAARRAPRSTRGA